MRDYKNIKVPRRYRTGAARLNVKRVDATRATGRTKRSGGLKRTVVNVFLVLLVAGGCWTGWKAYRFATHAPLFQIAGVDVTGARRLGSADLKAVAAVFTGRNIFRVNLEDAARQARANPWVKDVRIHRSLPNRISMVFTERVPAAILDTGAGKYLMDGDGVVIERIAKGTEAAWPLPVVAIRGVKAVPGEQAPGDVLSDAFELLADISSRGGWDPADVTVKADSPETVSILYAGHEFKFGSGNYDEKFRRLGEVMNDVQQRGLEVAYVDLRPERQAAAMVKKDARKPVSRKVRR